MIKKYNQFILEYNESIESICKKYEIENYTINENGTIDVDGDVFLIDKNLTKLPLNFRNVSGHFDCQSNLLKTLEGAPQIVGGYFNCYDNELITLEGSPKSVGGNFYCSNNQLKTLEGSPQSVGGDFDCTINQLTTLKGSPKSVRSFICSINQLTSLVDGPQNVVGDYYSCRNNKIKDFTGFPEFWEGVVSFRGNPVEKILVFFPEKLQSKAIYYINEFDAIHDGKILPERLEEVFHELELKVPEEIYTLTL